MIIQAPTPIAKSMAQRRLATRLQLWPEVMPYDIWNRKTAKGYTTIPRGLPLIQNIMDRQSKSKPVSGVYLDLWCRAHDEGFVECRSPQEMAFSSGFTTSRGVHIWSERITILESLGFIRVKPGQYGPRSFILLLNPYRVILRLKAAGQVEDDLWTALVSQTSQIGANDLVEGPPTTPPPS